MRNVSRLRLLYFLLFTSLLMCCPLCYSLPCRNYAPPSKAFLISSILVAINPLSTFSDPASSLEYFWWRCGIRTPVQNLFLFASYSNINHKVANQCPPYYLLQNYSNHRLQLCKSKMHVVLQKEQIILYHYLSC